MSDSIDGDSKANTKSGANWPEVAKEGVGAIRGIAVDGKRHVLENIGKFRARDRAIVYKAELGPPRLRFLRTHYVFAGFLALCATAILVVSIVMPGGPRSIINNVTNIFEAEATAETPPPPVTVAPIPEAKPVPAESQPAAAKTEEVVADTATKVVEVIVPPVVLNPTKPPSKPSDVIPDPVTRTIARGLGL